jgi:FMN phosphatase YigB (HAD superfamily)
VRDFMAYPLTKFKALVFDVYGTLADWETTIYDGLLPLTSKFPKSRDWTRKEILLAFSELERELQENQPELLYCDLLAEVYRRLEAQLSETPISELEGGEAKAFGGLVKDIQPFPDSSAALHSLAKYYKLCVLSNVDRDSFGFTHAKLSVGDPSMKLDAESVGPYKYPPKNEHPHWFPRTNVTSGKSPFTLILTAQDTGTYKPHLNGFRQALAVISEEPVLLGSKSETDPLKDVLWVAQSIIGDIKPAHSLGLKTVWIDRKGGVMGLEADQEKLYDWRFTTLAEFAAAVEEAFKEESRE